MNRDEIYRLIDCERDFQDQKWGIQQHSWPEWASILTEEVGELAKEINRAHFSGDERKFLALLRDEAIQVGAVICAMLELGVTSPLEEKKESNHHEIGATSS